MEPPQLNVRFRDLHEVLLLGLEVRLHGRDQCLAQFPDAARHVPLRRPASTEALGMQSREGVDAVAGVTRRQGLGELSADGLNGSLGGAAAPLPLEIGPSLREPARTDCAGQARAAHGPELEEPLPLSAGVLQLLLSIVQFPRRRIHLLQVVLDVLDLLLLLGLAKSALVRGGVCCCTAAATTAAS